MASTFGARPLRLGSPAHYRTVPGRAPGVAVLEAFGATYDTGHTR